MSVDVTLGLITEEEQKVLTELGRINRTDRIDSDAFLQKDLEQLKEDVKDDEQGAHHEITPNVYYVPLLWAVDLVNEAMKEKRITDHSTQRVLIQVQDNYCHTGLVLIYAVKCLHRSVDDALVEHLLFKFNRRNDLIQHGKSIA